MFTIIWWAQQVHPLEASSQSSRTSSSSSSTKKMFRRTQRDHVLPRGPELRSVQTDQHHRGSMQETQKQPCSPRRSVWRPRQTRSSSRRGRIANNNHKCAVVVQDLATQWIQSYPCKTKALKERREFSEVVDANVDPKVINADNSIEFAKACEDHQLYNRTSTLHQSETNDIAVGNTQGNGRYLSETSAVWTG